MLFHLFVSFHPFIAMKNDRDDYVIVTFQMALNKRQNIIHCKKAPFSKDLLKWRVGIRITVKSNSHDIEWSGIEERQTHSNKRSSLEGGSHAEAVAGASAVCAPVLLLPAELLAALPLPRAPCATVRRARSTAAVASFPESDGTRPWNVPLPGFPAPLPPSCSASLHYKSTITKIAQ